MISPRCDGRLRAVFRATEERMHLLHTAYEPAGDGPHPTIVALHGWGANGMDLLALAP